MAEKDLLERCCVQSFWAVFITLLFFINQNVIAEIDTAQIEKLLIDAQTMEYQFPSKSVDMLTELVETLHPQVHGQQFIRAHMQMASSLLWLGEAARAQAHIEKMINHPLLSDEQKAIALVDKARSLAWLMRTDVALELYTQAIESAHSSQSIIASLRAQAYRAQLYSIRGQYGLAISDLNYAFSLMESQGRIVWLWAEIFTIANHVFFYMGNYEKAMEYARKANRFLLELENPLRLAGNLINQARILARQERQEVALEFYEAANVWIKESNAPVMIHYLGLRVSELKLELGDIEEAEAGLIESMLFGDSKGDLFLQIHSRLTLIRSRMSRNQLDEVDLLLSQIEDIGVQYPTVVNKNFVEFYLLKAQFYESVQKYEQAFQSLLSYWDLRENTLKQQLDSTVNVKQVRLEAELNEKENRMLVREVALKSDEVEREQQQKMLLGFLLAGLLIVLGFVGYLLYKNVKLRRWLHELSSTDELTKVANRRHIMELMEFEVTRAHRYSTPFCAALLDIDHFKSINDTYGHHVGDEVLKRIAMLYQDSMRKMDTIGRYGGEEFVLVFPHTHISSAKQVLERLRQVTEAQVFDSMLERQVTVSIGLAELSDNESVDELLKRADQVLYEAKRGGRNRIMISPSTRQVAKAN